MLGRIAARRGGGCRLGRHGVGLLPAAASASRRHRRAEQRPDHPLAQAVAPAGLGSVSPPSSRST